MGSKHLVAIVTAAIVLVCSSVAWAQIEVEPDQRYLLLATSRTSTMQEELDEAAALGFRIVSGSPGSLSEIAIFLERVATPPDTYQYKLLATSRTSTMQRELEEAASQGFRLLPRTMVPKTGGWGGDEIVVVLERAPGQTQLYEYLLLATSLTGTLQTEVTQARDQGFTIAGLFSPSEHMVIMERPMP